VVSAPASFVCDVCRVEHPESDLGKNTHVNPDHEGCTGQLCKRCTYGDANRAERRAQGKRATCQTRCK
jgi:hypothetical protein